MEYINTTPKGARELAHVIYPSLKKIGGASARRWDLAQSIRSGADDVENSRMSKAYCYIPLSEGLRLRIGKES